MIKNLDNYFTENYALKNCFVSLLLTRVINLRKYTPTSFFYKLKSFIDSTVWSTLNWSFYLFHHCQPEYSY